MASVETVELTDPRVYWTNCSVAWHDLADGAEDTGQHQLAVYFLELANAADLMLYVLGA